MVYTRPRSRGEAVLSRHRFHKISPADRGAVRVHDGRDCVGTIVPVGGGAVDAVERPYAVFDQRDRRLGRFGGYRETLRAGQSRGRAS
jgi:hypothetical protein